MSKEQSKHNSWGSPWLFYPLLSRSFILEGVVNQPVNLIEEIALSDAGVKWFKNNKLQFDLTSFFGKKLHRQLES